MFTPSAISSSMASYNKVNYGIVFACEDILVPIDSLVSDRTSSVGNPRPENKMERD